MTVGGRAIKRGAVVRWKKVLHVGGKVGRFTAENMTDSRIFILFIVTGDGAEGNASHFPFGRGTRSRSIEEQRSGTIIRAARIIDGNRFRWYAKSGN